MCNQRFPSGRALDSQHHSDKSPEVQELLHNAIRNNALLSTLTDNEIDELIATMQLKQAADNVSVVTQGEDGDFM